MFWKLNERIFLLNLLVLARLPLARNEINLWFQDNFPMNGITIAARQACHTKLFPHYLAVHKISVNICEALGLNGKHTNRAIYATNEAIIKRTERVKRANQMRDRILGDENPIRAIPFIMPSNGLWRWKLAKICVYCLGPCIYFVSQPKSRMFSLCNNENPMPEYILCPTAARKTLTL